MNENGNGHRRGIPATDGRSAFNRLAREIEMELLHEKAMQEICRAEESVRFFGAKSHNGPYEAHLAKMTAQQFIDELFPSIRREFRQKARRLALDEMLQDRRITQVCDA